jgi:NTE family protein
VSDSHIGLALGSGMARGFAHIGVLRALRRLNVNPGLVCGTSIGALVGGMYLGGGLDAFEAWARRLNKLRVSRLLDFQFGQAGLIAGRRFRQIFEAILPGQVIENLPARFVCVTTELGTGHEVWLQQGSLLDAIHASCALPGFIPPAKIDGRWLLDGALVNPVPVSACRALGARYVIAVNLNADAFGQGALDTEAELGPANERPGMAMLDALPGAALVRTLLSRGESGPSLFTVMASALNIIQDRLTRTRLASDPPDMTISPKLGDIGLMQLDRAAECIAAGEQAVERVAPVLEAIANRRIENNDAGRRHVGTTPLAPVDDSFAPRAADRPRCEL